MEKYSLHGHQKSRDQLSWKLWRLLLNFVFWAIVDICFENLLPNLWDKILVVRSSIYWQLWISCFHETWILSFNYFGLNECRPFQRYMRRTKKTLGIVKYMSEFRLTNFSRFLQTSCNFHRWVHLWNEQVFKVVIGVARGTFGWLGYCLQLHVF